MFEFCLRYYLLYYTFSFGISLDCSIKKKKHLKNFFFFAEKIEKIEEIEESECFF